MNLLQRVYTVAKWSVATTKASCKKIYYNVLLQQAENVADFLQHRLYQQARACCNWSTVTDFACCEKCFLL